MKQVGRNLAVCLLALGLGADTLFTETSAAAPSRLQLLDRNLAAVEAADRAAPRDRWDPAYVVAQVGKDPARLFAWVRANTVWIPYRGVLRGPVGVLMDGRGNSLDRALLLATMLENAGHNVRLARGELDADDAEQLLPTLIAMRAASFGPSDNFHETLVPSLQATTISLPSARPAQTVAGQNQAAARAMATLDARVTDQTKRLLAAVARPADDDWGKRYAAARESLRDHWWVERRDGSRWKAMDLLSVDGDALASAEKTTALAQRGTLAHHEIAVRVVAERWSPRVFEEHVALDYTMRPAQLIGQSVVLQFWPTAPLIDAQKRANAKADLRGALLDQHEWGALLLVGRGAGKGGILRDSGDDPDAPSKGGAAGGAWGGAFGNTGTKPNANRSTLSAVWLEYEIRLPGEEPRKIRRNVFDLIGPAARAAGAPAKLVLTEDQRLTRSRLLMMRTEILPLASQIAPEFVSHVISASILGNRELLKHALRPDARDPLEIATRGAPTISSLYGLALAQWSGGAARRIFVDRPVVLTSHSFPKLAPRGATIVDATDIVANEVGVSLTEADAFPVRVAQGVRDTNAESLVRRAAVTGNAGDAFATSAKWATLTASDDGKLAGLPLSADVRRRIAEDLAAGFAVVAPSTVVPSQQPAFEGWWRVDPVTGHTLGLGENGWGSSTVEYEGTNVVPGAAGRSFVKRLGGRFMAGFVGNYGWCIAPLIQKNVNAEGFRFGLTASAHESVGECVGDSIAIGMMVTVPLLIIAANSSPRVVRSPSSPGAPPPKSAPRTPKTPEPDCRTTQVSPDAPTVPEKPGSLPDQRVTQRDYGDTGIDPFNTQVDRGDTLPAIPKSKLPPELADTVPAPERPGSKTAPMENRPQLPGKDLGAAEAPKSPPRQGPKAPRWDGYEIPTPAQLDDLLARSNEGGRAYEAKIAEVETLGAEAQAAVPPMIDKNSAWIRYRNKSFPESPFYDPENYDPTVDARLQKEADAAQRTSERAGILHRRAHSELRPLRVAMEDADYEYARALEKVGDANKQGQSKAGERAEPGQSAEKSDRTKTTGRRSNCL